MEFKNTLLVVCDMDRSKAFYKKVLGLDVIMDFGANVTLTGGICLQTKDTWQDFIHADEKHIKFGGNDAELYFEEKNFSAFIEHFYQMQGIKVVHPVIEHRWGQRVIRFYDPDWHVIEVGECMQDVCMRFLALGMTEEEVAKRMDVPVHFVTACKQS